VPAASHASTEAEIRILLITSIRTDGQTQQRNALNADIVAEYAALMRGGVEFPPVRVWWDNNNYWLTDGFHRLSAAELASRTELLCEVHRGSLSEAQWDSYAANMTHGLRRAPLETQNVITLALQHPKAATLSNVQIAVHLKVAETTVRRWRKKLSSADGEDGFRVVTRGGTSYTQKTENIGKSGHPARKKSRSELEAELAVMKDKGSAAARRLLNVIGNWAFGRTIPTDCLQAIERIVQGSKPSSAGLESSKGTI